MSIDKYCITLVWSSLGFVRANATVVAILKRNLLSIRQNLTDLQSNLKSSSSTYSSKHKNTLKKDINLECKAVLSVRQYRITVCYL